MEVLSKDIIVTWILPYLPFRPGGRRLAAEPAEVVAAILYKLKTGCQWRFLPVQQLLPQRPLSWQGVFYHFNEWRKQGAWKRVWLCV
ncbi:transposase, partial [Hymenobacter sp. UYP22]|uniref:transposase n=1 Tax=Hymenobacter sp. UYP22 TaxID=3156348 RepID=UPI00339150DD